MTEGDKWFKEVKKSKILEEYLKPLAKGTRISYRTALKYYYRFLDIDNFKDMDNYFKSGRNIKDDFLNFIKVEKDIKNKRNTTSVVSKSSCIQRFLEYNDIIFTKKENRGFKRYIKVYTHKMSDEYTPTKNDIKRLLQYADVKMKTAILMLSSSGMRIGELMNLQINDIHLDNHIKGEPLRLYLRNTKTGTNRVAWISPEATESLQEWLITRDRYIKTRDKRNFTNNKKVDNKLIPCHKKTVEKGFLLLTDKIGLCSQDKVTGFHKFTLHQLRKFFNSQLKFEAKLPERVVEIFMGHVGYLNGTYDQITERRLFEYYKEGMHSLLINEGFTDHQSVRNEIKDLKAEMDELRTQIKELRQFIVDGVPKP